MCCVMAGWKAQNIKLLNLAGFKNLRGLIFLSMADPLQPIHKTYVKNKLQEAFVAYKTLI